MNIIDILFENPLIIALLIWMLSSLFGGKKKSEEQEVRRSKPQVKKQEVPKEVQVTKQVAEQTNIKSEIEKRYEELKNRQNSSERLVPQKQPIRITKQSERSKTKKTKLDLRSPVQGIVWSEILREPRSKRPYHPSKRN
ncbi:hypothetical protein [Bacillus kexueae]|uniref:hypothetical protein n=1 Tax=Aeribacillus kexueae TaxID=2078952 RepID=UPI001FAFBFAA|nr:hypothetical protein [Bacillus kexueae]